MLLALLVILSVGLTGCGKSDEQVSCEEAGGTWDVYVITYTTTMVYNGKTYSPVLTPIYGTRCIGAVL